MKYPNYKKRACRINLDYNVEYCDEAMRSLKIMSIYDRLYLQKAKFMFKVYTNEAPENFNRKITVYHQKHFSFVY